MPGGDAAAQFPVQAAAGFLAQVSGLPDLGAVPFSFPQRFDDAQTLLRQGVRSFTSTSMGRLFDAAAALLGFTRGVSYEGQAAIWLEQLARRATNVDAYPFPFEGRELDFRPLLQAMVEDRASGRTVAEIGRAFQRGVASGLVDAITSTCSARSLDTVVLSGGVFQNELLLCDLKDLLNGREIAIWTNHLVPANDGGISLGQAAMAAFRNHDWNTEGAAHA
jgi:hydrogenase maturation protein HypF